MGTRCWNLALAVTLLCFSQFTVGATLTYPGQTPCDGTLQTCLDNAAPGDTVELATNEAITENLEVTKSVSLRAAEGFTPVIGGGAEQVSVDLCPRLTAGDARLFVEIDRLAFDFAGVKCNLGSDQPRHRLIIRNNTITFLKGESGFPVLNFSLSSTADVLIEDNTIDFSVDSSAGAAVAFDVRNAGANIVVEDNKIASTGAGIELFGLDATSLQARISRNRITASDGTNSVQGIEFDFRNGGNYSAAALGNVVSGIGGCNCGRNSGIHITTPSFTGQGVITINNNTVAGTEASAPGVLAVLQGEGDLILNVYNNTVSHNGGAGFDLRNSSAGPLSLNAGTNNSFDNGNADIFQNIGPLTPSDLDPVFVDASGEDYRLRVDSPLIDAGSDAPIGGTTETDAEGHLRISGGAIDVGAYEFSLAGPVFITDRQRFLDATAATMASAPYSPVNRPPEPFTSGDVLFNAITPSTLNFEDWAADFPDDNDVELAINEHEDLDIALAKGFAYAMGIDFDDESGGSAPSTFSVTVMTGAAQLARFGFETPMGPEKDFIGVWSREPFDKIQIREDSTANENEYFGTVWVGQIPLPVTIFRDDFGPTP